MIEPTWLLALLFLPLFPFSMIFTSVYAALPHGAIGGWLRAILLLVWPFIILVMMTFNTAMVPAAVREWLMIGLLATGVFYAFRSLALKEAGQWLSFTACSAWALFWSFFLTISQTPDPLTLFSFVLGLSLPLALMALLIGSVERRFGAAHTALDLRLASQAPRLAGLVVIGSLAVVATPVFPGFFVFLSFIHQTLMTHPLITGSLLLIWLLWTWSGALLIQGLIVGPQTPTDQTGNQPNPAGPSRRDMPLIWALLYWLSFILLAGLGLYWGGRWL